MVAAIFLPRLIVLDDFFIQDEQPWIDRSQMYVRSLFAGEFTEAVRFPLSNHPAITLMTVVGPVMNFYGEYHDLSGTYGDWSLHDKRRAATWARYAWGIACSVSLLALYGVVSRLRIFETKKWAASLIVVLLGLEPWILGISRSVSVDVLMAIGVVGMLVSAVVAYEKRDIRWVFISGIWFGVAFVSKSPALITAPLAIMLASFIPGRDWKEMVRRACCWVLGAILAISIIWPPFLLNPIERISSVLLRAELHSVVQEAYYWPGFHPPFFIFTLSAFATIGCLLYLWNRIQDIRKKGWSFFSLDVVFVAGIWHGLVLLYLNGDHARKNLPVLAILGFVGAVGWVWYLSHRNVSRATVIIGLLVLQGIFVWPYFPHVISSYNVLFSSPAGKRLLVDVGNGSSLVARYINSHDNREVYATAMDSLIVPHLDGDMRGSIRGLPAEGKLSNIDSSVTKIIIPASLPARVLFDAEAKQLLEELENKKPDAVLSVRDVPMFYVYTIRPIEYTTNHETGI